MAREQQQGEYERLPARDIMESIVIDMRCSDICHSVNSIDLHSRRTLYKSVHERARAHNNDVAGRRLAFSVINT